MENSKGGQGLAFKNLFKGLVRQLVGLRPFLLSLMTGVSFPQHKRKEEKTKNECCAYVHTHIIINKPLKGEKKTIALEAKHGLDVRCRSMSFLPLPPHI